MQRETWADYSKAIVICLMVWGHCCISHTIIMKLIFSFHMPAFFLISGYFDKSSQRTFLQTFQKNCRELLLPYLLFSIIGLSICWISPTAHPELFFYPNSTGDIFLAAIRGIFKADNQIVPHAFLPISYYWFLISLFSIRILFAAYQKILEACKRSAMALWFIPILLAIAIFPKLRHVYWFCIDSTLMGLPIYILGYVCKRYSIVDCLKQTPFILWFLLGFIFYFSSLKNGGVAMHTGNAGNHLLLFYFNAILGSLLLIGITLRLPSSYSWLQWIGRNTLPILLIHIYFVLMCKAIYQYIFHLNLTQIPLWLSLITTVIVISGCIGCIMVYQTIIKNKIKRCLASSHL